nr:MAG TPA: hypothetical protein [Caudoviricetes sp.]
MAQKVTLKDSTSGEIIYPQTLVDAVQDSNGTILSALVLLLNNTAAFTPTGDYNPATKKYVDDNSTHVVVQSAQPSGQNTGDFWYQVT